LSKNIGASGRGGGGRRNQRRGGRGRVKDFFPDIAVLNAMKKENWEALLGRGGEEL